MFRLFRRTPPPVPLAPGRALRVVGDIHGSLSALDALLPRMEDWGPGVTILLGDLVDRGEDSAGVIARARALPGEVVCLMGNHERMMLDFLDNPARAGRRWMRAGGVQTLASYDVAPPADGAPEAELVAAAAALRAAMPAGEEDWLRRRPRSWQSGNLLCVHAAADPDTPPDLQQDDALLWGHPGFLTGHRRDGICVIHGHTPVDTPERHPTRIAVDTGAWYSGRLTAACVTADGQLTFVGA